MSTTITLQPIARRRARGYSDGSQGADGVSVLARQAYLSMLRATWEDDDSAPMMPVHEYDRDPPTGQAYKCVWGYDKIARTEQSSCGAECYTYKLPADALDATNPDGVAEIASVTLRLAGDRYLDQGVCVWCELSSSAEPSPVSVAAAYGGVAYLATQNQLDADGAPVAPNLRHGEEAEIAVQLGGAAPAQYLHVHLFLADYFGVRGTWIEGGAMFSSEGASVAFSRDVAVSDEDSWAGVVALDVGRVEIGSGAGEISAADAVQTLPRAAMWQNFSLTADATTMAAETDPSFPFRVSDLLAFIRSDPLLWAGADVVAAATSVTFAGTGVVAFSDLSVGFCALCAHGHTRGRVYRGLRFGQTLSAPATIPLRVLVYGVAADLAIQSSAQGSDLRFATPLAWWGDILSRAFREGRATSIRLLSDPTLPATKLSNAVAGAEAVEVQPLAAIDAAGPIGGVAFSAPFRSAEISSVIVALIPDGAPSGAEGVETEYAATATRGVVAAIPVSATRRALTAGVTVSGGEGSIFFEVTTSVKADIERAVSGAGVASGAWNSSVMGMSSFLAKENFSTAKLTRLRFSFSRSGKTFSYDTTAGDAVPSFSFRCDLRLWRPSSSAGDFKYNYDAEFSGSFGVTARAADGSTMPVTIAFDRATVGMIGLGQAEVGSSVALISPAAWSDQASNRGRTIRAEYTTIEDIVSSANVTLPDYAYSFASAATETATADVTQSGEIRFAIGNVEYVAPWSSSGSLSVSLGSKTTADAGVAVGNDITAVATVSGVAPAFESRLLFSGSDGSNVWAVAALPAAQLRGDIRYQARSAYNNMSQGVGTVWDDGSDHGAGADKALGLRGTATVRQEFAASVEVDPGIITLYE